MNPRTVSLPVDMALRQIRSGSCYSTLRAIINVAFFFGLLAVLGGAGCAIGVFGQGRDVLLYALAAAFVGISLLVAARQALTLLVDIADTLIATHARGA